MPFLTIDGTRFWYEFEGEGEPLLQFHGVGLGHANFATVTPRLRKRFRVLDWDMRGFGDSDRPPAPYSLEGWAGDAAALLDALGLDRVHVHGTSMGGMVALVFAARYPERVKRMVVGCCMARYDTMAVWNKAVWKALARSTGMSLELSTLIALQCFSRDFVDRPEARQALENIAAALAKNDRELWIHFCELLEEADLTPLLPRIQAPTLLLSGEFDLMTPVDAGPKGVGTRKMAEMMPDATLKILPDCGHLNLVEKIDESCETITQFLLGGGAEVAAG